MGAGLLEIGRGFCAGEHLCHLRLLQIEGKSVEVALLLHLPATLSLASPMERSRLPLPSLLGLFGPLLMLSPELLMGTAGNLFEQPATNPEVQQVLAFAVEQYNKDTGDSTNYFKVLRLVKLLREVDLLDKYHLMVVLVQTRCKKRAGMIIRYKNIQKCPLLPGNQKKRICFFKVIQLRKILFKFMSELAVTLCT